MNWLASGELLNLLVSRIWSQLFISPLPLCNDCSWPNGELTVLEGGIATAIKGINSLGTQFVFHPIYIKWLDFVLYKNNNNLRILNQFLEHACSHVIIVQMWTVFEMVTGNNSDPLVRNWGRGSHDFSEAKISEVLKPLTPIALNSLWTTSLTVSFLVRNLLSLAIEESG